MSGIDMVGVLGAILLITIIFRLKYPEGIAHFAGWAPFGNRDHEDIVRSQYNGAVGILARMTNDEINVAIAQACGWKQKSSHFGGTAGIWTDPSGIDQVMFPDYCHDLNSMLGALATLKEEDWDMFESNLGWITGDRGFCKINATAKQRAEAFLLTYGK